MVKKKKLLTPTIRNKKKKIDSRNLFYYKRFHINLQVTGIEQSRYSLVFYRSMKVKCDKNQ